MITVIIVDEHQIIRRGLKMALEGKAHIEVVGECATIEESVGLVKETKPDVMVLDLSNASIESTRGVSYVVNRCTGIKVLALTARQNAHFIKRLKDAGAMGCLTNDPSPDELSEAVEAVARGEFFLQTEVAARAFFEFLRGNDAKPILSDREVDVVRLVAEGYDAKGIGAHLSITPRTAQTHLYHAMKKLGVHSRHELLQYAQHEGILSSSTEG